MKKILTASLVAMMAVTAANANIASTKYVDDRTGTATFTADSIKGSANLTAAVETLAGTVATNNTNVTQAINDAKTEITNAYEAADTALDGKITAEKEAREAADTALDGKITALDTKTTNALALKEDVANKATTEYTEGSTTQYPSIKIAEVIANTAVASTKTDLSTLTATVAANKTAADNAIAAAKSELQTELETEVGILEQADVDNLQAAKDYADSKDAAQTTTLQGEIATAKSGAETTAKNYTDAEITKIDTAYKAADATLQGAIDAINNGSTGVLATAKKYADDQDAAQTTTLQGEIATAKSGAETTAKNYTDAEITKIDTAYKAADAGLQEQITANKTAIEANDVDIKALQDKDATLTALASFPVACATGDSDCALVIREGTMKWEKVEY